MVRDCLASLETEIDPDQDVVVVVDNASGDDSLERLVKTVEANEWGGWVRLVASEHNGGFSAGNNAGIQSVEAAFYFLLNSDTIIRPGAIKSLLDGLQENPDAGLIGPRLEYLDESPQVSAFRFPSPVSEFIRGAEIGLITRLLHRYNVPLGLPETPLPCSWASFAAMVIRAEVIKAVGPMDEGYFMYFEDIDYCRCAQNEGWKVLYWPMAHVVHLRGGTSPVKQLAAAKKRRPRYYYQARTRYFTKFYGRAGLWLANALWTAGLLIAYPRQWIKPRPTNLCQGEILDVWTDAFRGRKRQSDAGVHESRS